MQLINAAYYTRTLWIHTGVIYNAKKTTLPMLDFVQRNLLLVYFHKEYVENQQRALTTADSGRHFSIDFPRHQIISEFCPARMLN